MLEKIRPAILLPTLSRKPVSPAQKKPEWTSGWVDMPMKQGEEGIPVRSYRTRFEGGHPACRFLRKFTPDGYPVQRRVRSWRHPRCDRLRVKGYVCAPKAPFQNLSRNLFLRGGFLPHPNQRRSMAQRDNRHTNGYLACTTAKPALRAVVRCSQTLRWGQTK
jgi:hypothetical protein